LRRHWSLKWQVTGFITLLVLPALAAAAYGYVVIREHSEEEAKLRLQSQTEAVTVRLEYVIRSAAELTALIDAAAFAEGCRDYLGRIQEHFERYNVIALGGEDGQITCSAPAPDPLPNVADRPWFQRALDSEETVLGDFQTSRTTGEANIIVAAPFQPEGGSDTRFVGAGLRLGWLSEFIGRVGLAEGTEVGIVDRNGTFLARYPDHEAWVGRNVEDPALRAFMESGRAGTFEMRGDDGVRRALNGQWIEAGGTRLFIFAGMPAARLGALASRVSYLQAGLIAAFGLLAVLLAILLARRHILQPLAAARVFAQTLAAGHHERRLDSGSATLEVALLIRALNRMAATLEQNAQDIDRACRIAGLGYWSLHAETGRMHWSKGVYTTFDVDPAALAEPTRDDFFRFIHPDERDQLADRIDRARREDRPPGLDFRVVRADGSIRFCHGEVALAIDAPGDGRITGICQDVTEQRELEDKFRQAQRLEAVGQLTGGVAHDFNNLLTVVVACTEALLEAHADNPAVREQAEGAQKAALRGADLTRRLLAFARRQPLDARPTDVNRLITDMEALLPRTLGETVSVNAVLSPQLWPAMIDMPGLENALLNLAINARDAMPEGGRLLIETANSRLDEDYAARHTEVEPGDYVMIAVSDEGQGMPPEVAARAFEPFFSTKDPGHGSGLGLSMVFGFVKQSKGHVKLYSEPGHGTTIRLYLPRAAEASAEPAAPPENETPAGRETVFLVEDDHLVRTYVAAQLEGLGYGVVAATNGAEALARLEAGEPVDLLFTDIVMAGGVSGYELAEAARRLRPDLPLLFTSGNAQGAPRRPGGSIPTDTPFLPKPYRRRDLARALRQALGSRDNG